MHASHTSPLLFELIAHSSSDYRDTFWILLFMQHLKHFEHLLCFLWCILQLFLFSMWVLGGCDVPSVPITQYALHALPSDGILFGRGMHRGGIVSLTPLWPLSWKRFRWFGISLSPPPLLPWCRGGGEHEGGWVFWPVSVEYRGGVCVWEHLHKRPN